MLILYTADDIKSELLLRLRGSTFGGTFQALQEVKDLRKECDSIVAIDWDRILHWAVFASQQELVTHLVASGIADLGGRDVMGRSPIFYGIMSGNFAMLRYVALALAPETLRAELEHQDVYGAVPLPYAVKFCSFDLVLFCLDLGGRPLNNAEMNVLA